MKRLVNKFIITLALSSFSLVLANSGPVYWQGYPSSDIMTIDKNSPIEVKSENLTFDFSDKNNDSYSIKANVKAEYDMTNPTNEANSVKMAFPFVERLNNLNFDDIKITTDGKELPYEVYLGKSIKRVLRKIKKKTLNLKISLILFLMICMIPRVLNQMKLANFIALR